MLEGTWLGLDVLRKGQYNAEKWNLRNRKNDGTINRKKERQNMNEVPCWGEADEAE